METLTALDGHHIGQFDIEKVSAELACLLNDKGYAVDGVWCADHSIKRIDPHITPDKPAVFDVDTPNGYRERALIVSFEIVSCSGAFEMDELKIVATTIDI